MKSFNTTFYTKLIAALSICTSSATLHAEIYRWVDENGVTNYSNEPVKKKITEGRFEIIEYTIPQKNKAPAEEQENDVTGEQDKKPTAEKLEALLSDEEIKAVLKEKLAGDNKQDNCTALRRNLAALNEKNFATYRDEAGDYRVSWGDGGLYKGKRTYLLNNEISTKTAEITEQIKQNCPQKDDDNSIQAKVRADWIRSEHCELNKAILADLKKPDLRSTDTAIETQQEVVYRYCEKFEGDEHRDDEDYYPESFPVRKTQAVKS